MPRPQPLVLPGFTRQGGLGEGGPSPAHLNILSTVFQLPNSLLFGYLATFLLPLAPGFLLPAPPSASPFRLSSPIVYRRSDTPVNLKIRLSPKTFSPIGFPSLLFPRLPDCPPPPSLLAEPRRRPRTRLPCRAVASGKRRRTHAISQPRPEATPPSTCSSSCRPFPFSDRRPAAFRPTDSPLAPSVLATSIPSPTGRASSAARLIVAIRVNPWLAFCPR